MKWIVVFEGEMIKAQIVKGLLESEGIPANLQFEAIGKIYGFTVDGLGKVKVLVPEDRHDEAKDLLKIREK